MQTTTHAMSLVRSFVRCGLILAVAACGGPARTACLSLSDCTSDQECVRGECVPARDAGEAIDAGSDGGALDAETIDAAVDDAVSIDAGPPPPLAETAEGMPADYACVGTVARPMGGASTSFAIMALTSPFDGSTDGVCTEVYPDGTLSLADTCAGALFEGGSVTASAPAGGWFAVRAFARPGSTAATTFVGVLAQNVTAPAEGETVGLPLFSDGTLGMLDTLTGTTRTGVLVSGLVVDCARRPVAGVVMRAFDDFGVEIVPGAAETDPRILYASGSTGVPSAAPHTDSTGRYFGLNVPAGAGLLRLEAWGRRPGDAARVRLGCERVVVRDGEVSLIDLGPLRSDAPEECR